MQRDIITVERFYTQQSSALGLKLLAGANGLKRLIREPTVNRSVAAPTLIRHPPGRRPNITS